MLTFQQTSPIVGATGGLQQNIAINNGQQNPLDQSNNPGTLGSTVIPTLTGTTSTASNVNYAEWILMLAAAYFAWEWFIE